MSIEEIARHLQETEIAPRDLVHYRSWLGGQYALQNARLTAILTIKPAIWNELRKSVKSDTATERVWEATGQGIEEMKLRAELKSIEKMMSATKSRIEVLEGEARNQY